MTIPDPPWKQKTRPCPFYSQGRCLFSDSCNFLHDVKIKVKNPEIAIITSPTPESTPALSRSNSITSSPTSSSHALRVRSPPRSPRISSLLLALGDVIEPDAEETFEEDAGEEQEQEEDQTTRFVPPDAVLGQVTRQRGGGSVAGHDPVAHTSGAVDACSPSQAVPAVDDPLTTPPRPSATHVRNSSGQRSVPSELMSPVELTLAPPYYHPITGLPQAQHRDSVDSGFGDNWTGPVPFALSPPNNRNSRRYSTLSLLSSPFGSPARALSPKVGPSSPLLARYSRHSSQGSAVEDAREDSLDELDSPTDYAARKRDSFVRDSPMDYAASKRDSFISDRPLEPLEPLETLETAETEPVSGQQEVDHTIRPPTVLNLDENGSDPLHVPTQEVHEQSSIVASFEPLEPPRTIGPQNAEFTVRPSVTRHLSPDGKLQGNEKQPTEDVHDSSLDVFGGPVESIAYQQESFVTSSPHQPSNLEYTVKPPVAPILDPGHSRETDPTPTDFASGTPLEETYSPIVFLPAPSVSPPVKRTSMSPAFHVPFFSPISKGTPLSPVFSVPSSSHSTAHPLDRPGTPKSPSSEEHDADDSAGDETQLYGSYYDEIPVADTSYYATPQMQHAVIKRSSTSGSSRRSRVFSPPPPVSPPASTASSSSLSILKPPVTRRESLANVEASGFPISSIAEDVSPRIAIVEAAETDVRRSKGASPFGQEMEVPVEVPDSRRNSRSMSPARSRESISSGQFSSVPPSPFEPRPASATDFNAETRQERRSSKVPFGFRHSLAARSRDSLLPSRPGSAPLVRHRPPALTGIGSNRSNSLNNSRPDLSSPTESLPSASRLRPLRLSALYSATSLSFSSGISPSSSAQFPQINSATTPATSQPSSPSVTSECSLSNNQLLSPARASSIPLNSVDHTLIPSDSSSSDAFGRPTSHASSASSASKHMSWTKPVSPANGLPPHRLEYLTRPSSRASEPIQSIPEDETIDFEDLYEPSYAEGADNTIRGEAVTSAPPYTRPPSSASLVHEPVHAIATPRPTLLFAIASDNVEEVRRVLESGEASANDNAAGPQSPLTFALTATQLKHRKDIVKLLLAHGASTSSLNLPEGGSQRASMSSSQMDAQDAAARADVLASVDPATRYYIARADAPQTRRASALIHRSFFRPLTKVRYDLIGQDRALEQLFRVLSMPTMAPIVVLFCGPSGHGKSLLARRFGSLLDVPTHTVNMTTLRSTRDIWRSYSMSPYEESSDSMLADFLMENEGKRCVVVLDEIEKTENETILSSLLMPWELGRVSFEAGHRHVDCSKVIWLGTSNIGHDLVFEHQATRLAPKDAMTRDEYVDLMRMLRPKVSDRLGPSLLSRVTTVLPFVPFTVEEQMAIASEALFSLSEDATSTLPGATVEKLVKDSLHSYVPAEGARSLYRAVSTQLLDTL